MAKMDPPKHLCFIWKLDLNRLLVALTLAVGGFLIFLLCVPYVEWSLRMLPICSSDAQFPWKLGIEFLGGLRIILTGLYLFTILLIFSVSRPMVH